MAIEAVSYRAVCDGCGKLFIIPKDRLDKEHADKMDYCAVQEVEFSDYDELKRYLIKEKWSVTTDGECYCPDCPNDGSKK